MRSVNSSAIRARGPKFSSTEFLLPCCIAELEVAHADRIATLERLVAGLQAALTMAPTALPTSNPTAQPTAQPTAPPSNSFPYRAHGDGLCMDSSGSRYNWIRITTVDGRSLGPDLTRLDCARACGATSCRGFTIVAP